MDSFLSNKSNRQETVEVEDLKRDLSSEFSTLQQSSIEAREYLRVYLRVRPLTLAESTNGESQECVTVEQPDTVLLKLPSLSIPARASREKSLPETGQRFQFSQVYGPETSQAKLFQGTVKDLVKDVLKGGNSLVFTYGVTNAGKTFTFLGPDCDAGILPRSLHMIFSSIGDRVFPGADIKPQRCSEFTRLSRAQQVDDALFKRNLFRQLRENDKSNGSLLNCTILEGFDADNTEHRISLHVDTNTRFSVWVSFCEIYNENIHDLLETMPSGALRRTALRLSQDIKGNAYVKDLRWVQVNSAQEAYTVMKFGKKNQSFSSTRLNQVSSRSHSIFSIRILRIEDVTRTPKVHTVSELCLCDLAGSERCAKTQNQGDRLKEAGNINTSLLILGKCINALRHNQQARIPQHVPFRESKLTHYLQSFFCGRGAACMIVNINQCASMYDETLNVLKFSAVAQKVVVLSSQVLPTVPPRSSSDVSFTINNADQRSSCRSSLIGWESSLEDVQEDEDDECDEGSLINDTMDVEEDSNGDDKVVLCKETHQRQVALLRQLQLQLKQERAEGMLMEAKIREEVSREFSELFSEMRADFDERLAREREILEERSECRMEIFKNLVDRISASGQGQDSHTLLQEASAALEAEKHAREEALAALEYQTSGKEEALSSLKEECRAREELLGEVEQLRKREQELQLFNVQERERRERAEAELQAERRCRLQVADTLTEEKQHREDELQSVPDKEGEEPRGRACEPQVMNELETDKHSQDQLEMVQKQLEQHSKELQDKSCLILDLQQKCDILEQELHSSKITSVCTSDELREEMDELRKKLSVERERHDSKERRVQQLEAEVEDLKQQQLLRQGAEESKALESNNLLKENSELQPEAALMEEMQESSRRCHALEEEAQKKLQDQEACIMSLQKALQERKEEERNAVQEARRAETERRRELLAVAHEAIAEKDAELQRKAEEISSLKESLIQEVERAKKLSVDLQRRDDGLSDLREKLSDYKKQIEQIQKEISVMRDEEKSLRQKLTDAEKIKKQLQSDLAIRDRTLQQIKAEQSGRNQELYQKACRELEAKERVMQEMRLTLTEQEDTQQQMETILEEKLSLIQELDHEMETLKAKLLQNEGDVIRTSQAEAKTDDITVIKQEAAQAEENLKTQTEKYQAERRKWQEEKLSLIGQAKEAENKRNQEMRKFAEDRERYVRQQGEMECQLKAQEQSMDQWRKERDTLVAALEVQLQKLISSQAEKDMLIQQLRCSDTQAPPEVSPTAAELQAALSKKEAQIAQLQTELEASRAKVEQKTETRGSLNRTTGAKDTRASVSSQGSVGGSAVLDSFEISTENGRLSRFPQPELEISFSPLQPNRMALRRQGEENAVTVKITRSARKRKSGEMEKSYIFRRSKRKTKNQDEVEAENRKNTRTRLTTHQEESCSPTTRINSQSSRKEGALQKIGDFLHSSPTLLGCRAKKMMSLMSGRSDADASSSLCSSSSLSLRVKKNRRKLYKPEISSPMDMSPHNMISGDLEEKDNDHQIMKRRLRTRRGK